MFPSTIVHLYLHSAAFHPWILPLGDSFHWPWLFPTISNVTARLGHLTGQPSVNGASKPAWETTLWTLWDHGTCKYSWIHCMLHCLQSYVTLQSYPASFLWISVSVQPQMMLHLLFLRCGNSNHSGFCFLLWYQTSNLFFSYISLEK